MDKSIDPALTNDRPFRMPAITVRGKYLTHEDIMEVSQYFLEQQWLYIKAGLRSNMVKLAAIGHQFTPEEWRASLDYDFVADVNDNSDGIERSCRVGAELKWNAEADEYNQWDTLDGEEKQKLTEDFRESARADEHVVAVTIYPGVIGDTVCNADCLEGVDFGLQNEP